MTHHFRTESDSLGKKEVPLNAYYGIQTLRAQENFPITGYKLNEALIYSIAAVKKAAALANRDIHQLPADISRAIVQSTDEILNGDHHDQFLVDPIQGGAGTSLNMNANEVIANRALEIMGKKKGDYESVNPNNHVNMSQSTNDVFPTTMHLAISQVMSQLEDVMKEMAATFKDKADEFDHIVKVGRTHLQDAVPIRLGQEFESYHRMVKRDLKRIERTRENFYEVNMGATAVGTGLNADPTYTKLVVEHLSSISGLPLESAENLVDATQNTDAYTELSSALKNTMTNLSKIANDLRLMASGPKNGLCEILLPARQPGSSIMPGKVNPVMPEVINQIAFQVIGNDQTISMASEAGQLDLNVMEPVLIFNLLESMTVMKNGFQVFTDLCLKDIQANEAALKDHVEKSLGVITALSPHIGYEQSAKIAQEGIKTNKSIRELCKEYNILNPEDLEVILDTYEMTYPGIAGSHLKEKMTV
ncbi:MULTISPECIES: aspartate ammonia-lyase [Pontibacillus]|uniref:Aspartate ammonia-lyase n=1 Tax=Pontibacillus chungwhensis TaxID=265426 RepID=A0ABY8V1E4_9BACI|nr:MULTISPECIES: aspartate ammonia-lyase [Pontibacillus]MCD5325985.1 aspartate ammonia-lyase [Pontibacillus sp. HN14]WIF98439.1 aspartate ammonia-lyase [Pontibacillus chungwhensis]